MPKYHIGDGGQPKICRAQHNCPLGSEGDHFNGGLTKAREWAEQKNAEKAGGNFNTSGKKESESNETSHSRSENAIKKDLNESVQELDMLQKQYKNLLGKKSQGFNIDNVHFAKNKEDRRKAAEKISHYENELKAPRSDSSDQIESDFSERYAEINRKRAEKGLDPIKPPAKKKTQPKKQKESKSTSDVVDEETRKVVDQARADYEADRAGLTEQQYQEKFLTKHITNIESHVAELKARVDNGYAKEFNVNTKVMNSRGQFVPESEYELEEAQNVLRDLYTQHKVLGLKKEGRNKAAKAYADSAEHYNKNKYFDDLRAKKAKLSGNTNGNKSSVDQEGEKEEKAVEPSKQKDKPTPQGNNDGNTDKLVRYYEERASRAHKRLKLAKEILDKNPTSEKAQAALIKAETDASESSKQASSARNGDEMSRGTATVAGAEIAVSF